MKKLLALLLVLVMILPVFVGCGEETPAGTTDAPVVNPTEDDSNKSTLPDDITLTVGIPQNASVEDYDTNALTLWIEEVTGYELEFQLYMPMASDYKSKLSTAMVSGDELPDLLIGFDLGRKFYQDMGDDGYLVDLAPFFEDEEMSKVFWERFESIPDEEYKALMKRNMYDDDGRDEIWGYPRIEYSTFDPMDHQAFINTKWLEAVGMEMPTNKDELYEVLKAFRDKDPNGNGKKDEIPLLGAVTGFGGDPVAWIMNMYFYHDDERYWREAEDGTLYTPYTSDEYRESLIFIRKLVDEGLLSKSCWGLSTATMKGLMNPVDGVETVGIICRHPHGMCVPGEETLYDYAAMPMWGYADLSTNLNSITCFITTDCEYPEAAWNVLNLFATEEGSFRLRYGEKGVDWDDADEGTLSFLGRPAGIKVMNSAAFGGDGNECWNSIYCGLLIDAENEVTQMPVLSNYDDIFAPENDPIAAWDTFRYNMMADMVEYYYEAVERNPDNVVPSLQYTVEEDEEISADRSNAINVITTARASFLTGQSSNGKYTNPSDDAQWNAYLAELEEQGINAWREMAQFVWGEMKKDMQG